MDKINLGSTIPAYPMPVSLVGAHVDDKPNFLAVAWFTMVSYKPPRIAIALGKGHYTNPGIKENKSFSVCLPSEDMAEVTDYCGIVSGKKTDKSGLFDLFLWGAENSTINQRLSFKHGMQTGGYCGKRFK